MRLARELERRLERLVEGATAAVFRGTLHPVDIADRMIRQLEFLESVGFAGEEIPNHITVTLSRTDLDDRIDRVALGGELMGAVEATAEERGWRLNGPVEVEVVSLDGVPKGLVECTGTTVIGDRPAWGQLIRVDGGGGYALTDNRVTIGRALECDVSIQVPEISRQHALVVRSAAGYEISDLGSSNGTGVNGRRVDDTAVHIVPGDEIDLGNVVMAFRTV